MSFLDARSFLIEVLEHSLDGILAVDAQSRIVIWSSALERLFGKTKAGVLGQPLLDALPFLRETGEDWSIREALAGRATSSRGKRYFLPETGREGWYEASYVPLRDGSGEIVGMLGILRERAEAKAQAPAPAQSETRDRAEAAPESGKARPKPVLEPEIKPAVEPDHLPPPDFYPLEPHAAKPAKPTSPLAAVPPPQGSAAVRAFGADATIFDRQAALTYVGDPDVLEELIQGFIVSLPEFVREMDLAVGARDLETVSGQAEDVRRAMAALGGVRATHVTLRLAAAVAAGDADEVQRLWWRLRRELAVFRETLRTYQKSA